MKQWKQPEMLEIEIVETAYDAIGIHLDGGYTGDNELNGHMTFNGDKCAGQVTSKLTGETYTCWCYKGSDSSSDTDTNS